MVKPFFFSCFSDYGQTFFFMLFRLWSNLFFPNFFTVAFFYLSLCFLPFWALFRSWSISFYRPTQNWMRPSCMPDCAPLSARRNINNKHSSFSIWPSSAHNTQFLKHSAFPALKTWKFFQFKTVVHGGNWKLTQLQPGMHVRDGTQLNHSAIQACRFNKSWKCFRFLSQSLGYMYVFPGYQSNCRRFRVKCLFVWIALHIARHVKSEWDPSVKEVLSWRPIPSRSRLYQWEKFRSCRVSNIYMLKRCRSLHLLREWWEPLVFSLLVVSTLLLVVMSFIDHTDFERQPISE